MERAGGSRGSARAGPPGKAPAWQGRPSRTSSIPAVFGCHRQTGAFRDSPLGPSRVEGRGRLRGAPAARPPRPASGFQLLPLRPPPPRATSLSVLILQSCTRRELSMGGWFFGFLFSVGLFNLMICKVMSLFLFYTFLLIFNLCLEDDSCNCTFFCLLTRINDNFVLGGCTVWVLCPRWPSRLRTPVLHPGAPSQREARAAPDTQWLFTERPPRAARLLPAAASSGPRL